MKEVKENIQSALKQFSSGAMADSTKNLLNVLSYESERPFSYRRITTKASLNYFRPDYQTSM